MSREKEWQGYYRIKSSFIHISIIIVKIKMQEDKICTLESGIDENPTLFLLPGLTLNENASELLLKYYDSQKHQKYLTNYCYRCHDPSLAEAYNRFRMSQHIEIQEPKISKFYCNEAFFDLNVLSSLFDQKLGDHIMPPVPKDIKHILDSLFTTFGYVPNLERFLLFFPTYLEKKWVLQQKLFEEGTIDRKIAFFLAFSGATELGCTYLMTRYFRLFKQAGGNPSWITEGSFPPKYKVLIQLNKKMARAVWQISEESIVEILETKGAHWSHRELTYCIEILAYSHHASTIALAMGLNVEDPLHNQELEGIEKLMDIIDERREHGRSKLDCTQTLSVLIPNIKECQSPRETTNAKGSSKMIKQLSQEEEIRPYMKEIGLDLVNQKLYQQIHQLMPNILSPFRIINKRREHVFPLIEYSEFNFNFMAYPLLNKYTDDTADTLRSLIDYTLHMTKGKYSFLRFSFGSKTISNTREFRKAMIFYSQNLCGYRHMQYNYKHNFSTFLTIALRFYIKLLTMSPAHINLQVIKEINHESGRTECFDLGHVAVLIASVKLSLELTLTTRAFSFQ